MLDDWRIEFELLGQCGLQADICSSSGKNGSKCAPEQAFYLFIHSLHTLITCIFLSQQFSKARPCPQCCMLVAKIGGLDIDPLYLQAHSAHHPLKPRSPRGSSGSVAVNRANNLCDAFGPTLVLPPTYFRSAMRFSFSLWLL